MADTPAKAQPRTRKVARSAPGANTTNVLVPDVALVVLDKPIASADEFTLTSSNVRPQTKLAKAGQPVDPTHDQLKFPLKTTSRKQVYALVQNRAGKSAHTVFTKVPAALLTRDGETAPRYPAKQYFRFTIVAPTTSDADLPATPPDWQAINVKEPRID